MPACVATLVIGRRSQGRNRDGEMVVATTRSHSSPEVQEAALRVQPDAQRVLAVGGAGNKAMMLMDGEVSHYGEGKDIREERRVACGRC